MNKQISIKVYFLIPKSKRYNFEDIIYKPDLIIETLILNKQFEIINNIFYYFPQLKNEKLIAFYALCAMSLNHIIDNLYKQQNEETEQQKIIPNSKIENELLKIKTTNYKNELLDNDNKEELFYFNTAPDFILFISFMNLCNDINIVSNVCFKVSNLCSLYLLEKDPKFPKILFINFINKILDYLRLRLKQIDNNNDLYEQLKYKLTMYENLNYLFKEFIYVSIIIVYLNYF